MAVVPTYGLQKVDPSGPVYRVAVADTGSAQAFGATQGQQIQQVGQAGLNIGQVMLDRQAENLKKENVRKANEALAGVGDTLRDYLNNPEKGLFARQGGNAVGSTKEATDYLEKMQNDVLDKLENDSQREFFKKLWIDKRETTLDNIARHEASQKRQADEQSSQLVVKDAIADVSTNYTNSEMRQEAMNRALAAIDQNLGGLSPEALQAQKDAALSTMHSSVVERYLDSGNQGMANAYYKAHRNLIQGDDAGRLDKSLKEGNERANAYNTAEKIANEHPDDLAAQIVAARQISDTKVQDRVLTELKQRYNDDQVINEAKAQADLGDARQYLAAGKPVPPTVMAKLTPEQQKSLREVQAAGGLQNVSTQTGRYFELASMARSNPEAFARVDMGAEFHRLKQSDFAKLETLQEQIRKKVPVTTEDATKFLTVNEMVNLKAKGAKLTEKGNEERLGEFQMALEHEVSNYELTTGKKVTTEDINTLADKLLLRKGGFLSFGGKYKFETADRGNVGGAVAVDQMMRTIPQNDYRQIYTALQRALGRAPLPREILNAYKMGNK